MVVLVVTVDTVMEAVVAVVLEVCVVGKAVAAVMLEVPVVGRAVVVLFWAEQVALRKLRKTRSRIVANVTLSVILSCL